jgi:prophage tail gpP-like protein
MQRNLHCIDDPQGNMHFFRTSAATGNSNQALVEKVNILAARSTMQQNMQVPYIEVKAQAPATDAASGPVPAQASATVYNANYAGSNRPFEMILEEPGDTIDCSLRGNHEMQTIGIESFEVIITVAEWLAADGKVWFARLREIVAVQSPTLLPLGSTYVLLLLKGVKAMQDSEHGSRTELTLCLQQNLGSGATIAIDTPPGMAGPSTTPNVTPPATTAPPAATPSTTQLLPNSLEFTSPSKIHLV